MSAASTNGTDAAATVLFQPDETLDMLGDMLSRALQGKAGTDWRKTLWPALSELGLFAALLSEEDGGYGGARTAGLACRLLAEAGAVTPFAMSSAAIGRTLAGQDAPSARAAEISTALAEGSAIASLALHERDALPAIESATLRLTRDGEGWRLDGAKRMVAYAGEARWLILPSRTDGGELAAVAVEASLLAGSMRHYQLIDGTPAADIEFARHAVVDDDVLATGAAAASLLAEMCDALAAAQCAETVGAMRAMTAATRDYLGTRRQFGQALASNQALRHRFIDMEIALAKAETMAALAAAAMDEPAEARARVVASARHVVLRAGWKVSQEAIQMHGAIGMANETPLGAYFKRILALALWLGDEDAALGRLAG